MILMIVYYYILIFIVNLSDLDEEDEKKDDIDLKELENEDDHKRSFLTNPFYCDCCLHFNVPFSFLFPFLCPQMYCQ